MPFISTPIEKFCRAKSTRDFQPPVLGTKQKNLTELNLTDNLADRPKREAITLGKIGKFLVKKLTKRPSDIKSEKVRRIKSKYEMRRKASMRSVVFWEEEFSRQPSVRRKLEL